MRREYVGRFIRIGQVHFGSNIPSLEHRNRLSRSEFISGTRMSPSIWIPSIRPVAGPDSRRQHQQPTCLNYDYLTFASTTVKLAEKSRTISLHCSGLSKNDVWGFSMLLDARCHSAVLYETFSDIRFSFKQALSVSGVILCYTSCPR